MPITQNVDVTRKWRGTTGTTEWILATFPANQSADTFWLFGLGNAVTLTVLV